jgi:hypothetical protein
MFEAWLLFGLCGGIVAALVANAKKRNAAGWFFAVFFFPFLLLAILFIEVDPILRTIAGPREGVSLLRFRE